MFREKQQMLAIVTECEHKYGRYAPITCKVRKLSKTLAPTETNVKFLRKRVDNYK